MSKLNKQTDDRDQYRYRTANGLFLMLAVISLCVAFQGQYKRNEIKHTLDSVTQDFDSVKNKLDSISTSVDKIDTFSNIEEVREYIN